MRLQSLRRWRSTILCLPLALGACTAAETLFDPKGKPPEPAAGTPAPVPPAAAATGARNARTALALPPPPRPDPVAPVKLIGLSRMETEGLLGRPAAEAERSPAKVWQYRGGDCTVDVYFYLDVARNDFYALHYEARGPVTAAGGARPGGSSEGAERCLRRLHDANRAR